MSMIEEDKKLFDFILKSLQNCNHVIPPSEKSEIPIQCYVANTTKGI